MRCSQPLTDADDRLTTRLRSATPQAISDALPFGRLWYGEPDAISNAIGYAKFLSRSRDAVIRVWFQQLSFCNVRVCTVITTASDAWCDTTSTIGHLPYY
jgi:hypothetical protein